MKFKTKILQKGNNTGIEVPEAILQRLNAGKKPPVVVTLNGYTYRNTVAVMNGKYLIALSAEHRKNAQVKGGDELEISLELDLQPRTVELPEAFKKQLNKQPKAKAFFETLAPGSKKKIVLLLEAAKTPETLQKRTDKFISDLEQHIKP